jgi:hypothetical protein
LREKRSSSDIREMGLAGPTRQISGRWLYLKYPNDGYSTQVVAEEKYRCAAPKYISRTHAHAQPRTFMMAGSLTVPSPRTAKHSSALPRLPLPRTTGTPLSVAISLARILSPKRDRTSGDGPTHPTPESDRDLAKGADSERKPYPACVCFRFSGERERDAIRVYWQLEHCHERDAFFITIFKILVSDDNCDYSHDANFIAADNIGRNEKGSMHCE